MRRSEEDGAPLPGEAVPQGAGGDMQPAARWLLWLTLVALVVAGLGLGGWWLGGRGSATPQAATQPARVPVELAEARTADVPIYLNGLGVVQAFNTVQVRSRVDGTLVEIAFTEGQMVREGEVLARIDPRPYQAALDQAVAKKAQDEATLASSRLDLQRTQQLATRAFAPQQQLDQQTATVAAQEALVQGDQAAIDNARTQLDYTTIRSPLSGRLGLRLVDQGNIVRATDTGAIVEVAQLQPISVLLTAPEGQLPAIQEAMRRGRVEVAALAPDGRAELGLGSLALINNEVDAASGTVRLKATFDNADGRLWPGLSVNTRLKLRVREQAIVVPDTAVLRGQNELFAFVIDPENRAEKRTLKVGPFSEGLAVVEDGLKAGERVVTAGQSRLTANMPVEVLKTANEPPRAEHRAAATPPAPGSGSK